MLPGNLDMMAEGDDSLVEWQCSAKKSQEGFQGGWNGSERALALERGLPNGDALVELEDLEAGSPAAAPAPGHA